MVQSNLKKCPKCRKEIDKIEIEQKEALFFHKDNICGKTYMRRPRRLNLNLWCK